MQLILKANDICQSTAHFIKLNRSRKKLIYAKTMETRQESKG